MTEPIHSGAHGALDPGEPSFHFDDERGPASDDHTERHGPGDRSTAAPDGRDAGGWSEPDAPAATAVSDAGQPAGEPGAPGRKRRRRGSRGGKRRRGRSAASAQGAVDAQETAPDLDAPAGEPAQAFDAEPPSWELPFEDEEPAPDSGRERPLESGTPPAQENGDEGGPRRRRSRRGRRRRAGAGEAAPQESKAGGGGALAPRVAPRPPAREPRAVPRELDAFEPEALPGESELAEVGEAAGGVGTDVGEPGPDGSRRRRRGSRGGRRRKKAGRAGPGRLETAAEVEAIPGEEDDLPRSAAALPAAVAEPAPVESPGRSRRRRGREKAQPVDVDSDEPRAIPESDRKALILVNATDPEEQRVAVIEGERIVDFLMTVKDQDTLVNDIYRGRVVNLEPAIGAAFVDFGEGRNGFLHTSDVLSAYGEKDFDLDKLLSIQIDPEEWDENSSQPQVGAELDGDVDPVDEPAGDESGPAGAGRGRRGRRGRRGGETSRAFRARPRLPITDLLKKGQTVVVQVTKDAIGDKGPTLTTYISIPGRYLVLMPSMARTGVSRKIEDDKERRRLKRILQSLEVPKGMGVIVRTAGVGHSKAEIKRDLDYLINLWQAFGQKLHEGHGPAALYRESDVAIRTMRDLYSPTTKAVIVDDPEVQRHIVEFTEKLMPEDVGRIQLHSGQKPLFQAHGLEPDFERIFARRIELPSGGSIVFDQAEALVAIDVNSGRTRSDGFDFEEIALKTNLEAVPEIARQMRLRDLGGIIVVDFIDMMKLGNIRQVEKAFQAALSQDRARSKIGRISQFGLLEMTRQRLGPGMSKKVFQPCGRCRGTGRIRTVNSRAAAILRRLSSAMTHKGFQVVEVRAHPEVVRYLKDECSDHVRALEYRFQRDVRFLDAPDQAEDSVLRYLRADGKEVRPGGRRKR